MSHDPARAKPPASGLRPRQRPGGWLRLRQAVRYSMRGLRSAFRHEAAFRQEVVAVVILAPVAVFFPFSSVERVLLIGSLLLVLIVELLNSGIEAAIDRISAEDHPLSGHAKDVGSAAVMLSLVLAALTWLAIGGPIVLGLLLPPI